MINYLGIDYGSVRVGLALGNDQAKLASAFKTIPNDEQLLPHLHQLLTEEGVEEIVMGLPRGLDGQETAQTRSVYQFVELIKQAANYTIHLQDEAGTSVEAKARSKSRKAKTTDVDSTAAAIILQDFLDNL